MYSTVACAEEFNTFREGFDIESGMAASVVLRCAYADRHALVADILGNSRTWPNSGFANPPQAVSASIVGDNACALTVGQQLVYQQALVTINYSTKIKDLISESLEPNAEFLTQDYKRFRWAAANGDPLLEAEAPGRLLRSMSIVRTLYNLSAVPIEVLDLVGSCNDDDYTSALLGLTFPEETLLYQPPNQNRIIRTNGTEGWTLTLKFLYKPEGWNKYWRAKTQSYEKIFLVDPAGEYKNYPPDDMSALLF